jgi:hypothetical protein
VPMEPFREAGKALRGAYRAARGDLAIGSASSGAARSTPRLIARL